MQCTYFIIIHWKRENVYCSSKIFEFVQLGIIEGGCFMTYTAARHQKVVIITVFGLLEKFHYTRL